MCVFVFSCYSHQMWACALGHTEAAVVLYQWDSRALGIPDSLGRLPLNIARSRGHTRLADLLEQLQQAPHTLSQPAESWIHRWSGESQPSSLGDTSAGNSNQGKEFIFYIYRNSTWLLFLIHLTSFTSYSLLKNTFVLNCSVPSGWGLKCSLCKSNNVI